LSIRVDNEKFDINGVHNKYADYVVVVCSYCTEQYVHDDEHSILYYNPHDHSKWFVTHFGINDQSRHYPIPCKGCGNVDWDFIDLKDRDKAESGPWRKYIRSW
jgi:hypothetical protein